MTELHPATAIVRVDGQIFECSEPDDWAQSLLLAQGDIVELTVNGRRINGRCLTAWAEAARHFARMTLCYSCEHNHLDPDQPDAFRLELCQSCYDAAGLENEHADGYHDTGPVDGCADCRADTRWFPEAAGQ